MLASQLQKHISCISWWAAPVLKGMPDECHEVGVVETISPCSVGIFGRHLSEHRGSPGVVNISRSLVLEEVWILVLRGNGWDAFKWNRGHSANGSASVCSDLVNGTSAEHRRFKLVLLTPVLRITFWGVPGLIMFDQPLLWLQWPWKWLAKRLQFAALRCGVRPRPSGRRDTMARFSPWFGLTRARRRYH